MKNPRCHPVATVNLDQLSEDTFKLPADNVLRRGHKNATSGKAAILTIGGQNYLRQILTVAIFNPQPDNTRGTLADLLERQIQDWIPPPILIIKVPPFGFIDTEALRFHGAAEQVAVPALQRCASGI